ncbi:hypothetical protein Tco_1335755 [Tanacetum coccineum]
MTPTTRRGHNTPTDNTNPNNITPESVQAMIDQALVRNSTNEDTSHRTEGVVGFDIGGLKDRVRFSISVVVLLKIMVKFGHHLHSIRVLLDMVNGRNQETRNYVVEPKGQGNKVPATQTFPQELTLICTKFIANKTEKVDKCISGLLENIYGNVKSARPKTLDKTIELANDLMDQKLSTPITQKLSDKQKEG